MTDVVFLVGAGRSGTTLLYKLLALHPDVSVFTNYDSKLLQYSPSPYFMRLIRRRLGLKKAYWFEKSGAAYFKPGLKKYFPYPVEGEPLYTHCGVPLVLEEEGTLPATVGTCLQKTFENTLARSGGRTFLSKRTANNRRLEWLREVFPQAKYINLVRDGREVAHSLSSVNWWEDHTVWWSGKTAAQMEAEGWDRLDICARNWVEEVRSVEAGLATVPSSLRFDLRYENLLGKADEVMEQLLAFMGLTGSEEFRETIAALSLTPRPAGWRKNWTDEQKARVEAVENDLLLQHRYI